MVIVIIEYALNLVKAPLKKLGGETLVFENVVSLCKKNGVSISALEKELGLGNATVRGWATSDPGASKLKRVADRFGVTVDYLLQPHNEETEGGT